MLGDLIDSGLLDYVAMDIKAPLNDRDEDVWWGSGGHRKDQEAIVGPREVEHGSRVQGDRCPDTPDPGRYRIHCSICRRNEETGHPAVPPQEYSRPNFAVVKPYDPGAVKAMAENAKRYVRKVVIRGDI